MCLILVLLIIFGWRPYNRVFNEITLTYPILVTTCTTRFSHSIFNWSSLPFYPTLYTIFMHLFCDITLFLHTHFFDSLSLRSFFKIKNLCISCSIKQSWFARILFSALIKTHFYTFSWTVWEENAREPATGARCEKRPSCHPAFSTVCSRSWCVVTGCDWHWEVWLARVCLLGGRGQVYIRLIADSSRRSAGNWGGDR